MKTKTPVVFRTWRDTRREVIALFPSDDAGNGLCSSYMHVGQHGAADYAVCIARTRPATATERKPLLAELHKLGYRGLREYKRRPKS